MKKWKTLITREISKFRLVIILLLMFAGIASIISVGVSRYYLLPLSLAPLALSLVLLPVLPFLSYTFDWRDGTASMLLTLPIRRATIAASRYLTFLIIGFGILLLSIPGILWNLEVISQFVSLTPSLILLTLSLSYLAFLSFLMSLSLFVRCLTLVIHKKTIWMTIITLISGWLFYLVVLKYFLVLFAYFMREKISQLENFDAHSFMFSQMTNEFNLPIEIMYAHWWWVVATLITAAVLFIGSIAISENNFDL